MLNKLSCLAIIAALSSMPLLAHTEGFYVGGQLSNTTLKETEASYSESTSFMVLSGLAGYKFNPYFAIEARLGSGINDEAYIDDGDRVTLSVARQSAIMLKGIVPINDAFSLYGIAGMAAVKYDLSITGNNFTLSDSETLDGFSAGVGAEFNVSPQLALTLEYMQLPDKTFGSGIDRFRLQTNSVSLGVNYRF